MLWNIIADSSCNLFDLEEPAEQIRYSSVPFIITVGDTDYVDDSSLDVVAMLDAMDQCSEVSHTSCPPPQAWYHEFEKPGHSIALTISGHLSGSYSSACAAKAMMLEEHPDRQIGVIDTCSTGPEMCLLIRKLRELILEGRAFESVMEEIERYRQSTHIIFALSSYNNLIKNGRMNRLVGMLANKLNLWGIGIGSEAGEIRIRNIARGSKRAVDAILQDMKERGRPEKSVVIDHCDNPGFAELLKEVLHNVWPHIEVTIHKTRGLCSYYAERHGVIVGY